MIKLYHGGEIAGQYAGEITPELAAALLTRSFAGEPLPMLTLDKLRKVSEIWLADDGGVICWK